VSVSVIDSGATSMGSSSLAAQMRFMTCTSCSSRSMLQSAPSLLLRCR
jgi:hypothetical protein